MKSFHYSFSFFLLLLLIISSSISATSSTTTPIQYNAYRSNLGIIFLSTYDAVDKSVTSPIPICFMLENTAVGDMICRMLGRNHSILYRGTHSAGELVTYAWSGFNCTPDAKSPNDCGPNVVNDANCFTWAQVACDGDTIFENKRLTSVVEIDPFAATRQFDILADRDAGTLALTRESSNKPWNGICQPMGSGNPASFAANLCRNLGLPWIETDAFTIPNPDNNVTYTMVYPTCPTTNNGLSPEFVGNLTAECDYLVLDKPVMDTFCGNNALAIQCNGNFITSTQFKLNNDSTGAAASNALLVRFPPSDRWGYVSAYELNPGNTSASYICKSLGLPFTQAWFDVQNASALSPHGNDLGTATGGISSCPMEYPGVTSISQCSTDYQGFSRFYDGANQILLLNCHGSDEKFDFSFSIDPTSEQLLVKTSSENGAEWGGASISKAFDSKQDKLNGLTAKAICMLASKTASKPIYNYDYASFFVMNASSPALQRLPYMMTDMNCTSTPTISPTNPNELETPFNFTGNCSFIAGCVPGVDYGGSCNPNASLGVHCRTSRPIYEVKLDGANETFFEGYVMMRVNGGPWYYISGDGILNGFPNPGAICYTLGHPNTNVYAQDAYNLNVPPDQFGFRNLNCPSKNSNITAGDCTLEEDGYEVQSAAYVGCRAPTTTLTSTSSSSSALPSTTSTTTSIEPTTTTTTITTQYPHHNSNSTSTGDGKASPGTVAAAVIGSLLGIVIVGAILKFIVFKKRAEPIYHHAVPNYGEIQSARGSELSTIGKEEKEHHAINASGYSSV